MEIRRSPYAEIRHNIMDSKTGKPSESAGLHPLDEAAFLERADNPREASSDPTDQVEIKKTDKLNWKSLLGISKFTDEVDRQESAARPEPREWTVLCYFNGNSDLESDMEQSMKELQSTGSDDKIAFVAQMARESKGGEAERLLLKKPKWMGLKSDNEVTKLPGKTNMADPNTLRDFLSWGMKTYPAKHYAVIMNGHGYGFAGSMPDSISKDVLLSSELKSAVDSATKETGRKIDIMGFDSCLMANAETAHAVKDSVNFLVGSEEVLVSGNWGYEEFASKMKEEANGDGLSISEALKSIINSQNNGAFLTTSIINCRQIDGFSEKLSDFSQKLLNTKTPPQYIKQSFRQAQHYCQPQVLSSASNGNVSPKPMDQMRDVVSLAMSIITNNNIGDTELKESALNMAKFVRDKIIIFEAHRKDTGLTGSTGMSIYAPASEAEKYGDFYDNKVPLGVSSGWGKVIKKYGVG
ncbi:MAG: clostripain-related cysteine peptidase [Firmicutes bacterium]|nr:clostripain-related cysteine peptidase [Bacillota bacterium]